MITIFRGTGDDRNLWTVAALKGDQVGGWTSLRDCSSVEEAMAWMCYLNGGPYPAADLARAK